MRDWVLNELSELNLKKKFSFLKIVEIFLIEKFYFILYLSRNFFIILFCIIFFYLNNLKNLL